MDLPNSKNDIKIDFIKNNESNINHLHIYVKHSKERKDRHGKVVERYKSESKQVYPVNVDEYDAEKMKAKLENKKLIIELIKKKEEPINIEINKIESNKSKEDQIENMKIEQESNEKEPMECECEKKEEEEEEVAIVTDVTD